MFIRSKVIGSVMACVSRPDGKLLKVGILNSLQRPALVDPCHVMLGAGNDDWGVCLFLTVADAARFRDELTELIAEHTSQG